MVSRESLYEHISKVLTDLKTNKKWHICITYRYKWFFKEKKLADIAKDLYTLDCVGRVSKDIQKEKDKMN